jgi:peptidoglycan/LPS O-acetylase OafA/YrhL
LRRNIPAATCFYLILTMGRFARDREMLRFLWGRFTRIYPTYWFYFFLTAVVYFIKPSWVNSLYGHQTELLTSFLLFPNQQPLVMVAWSLSHELWFYSIFAVLLNIKERWLLPSLLVWGMIVTMANVFATTAKLSAGIRVALHPYSLEFIIGALVAIFVVSECSRKISVRLSLSLIPESVARKMLTTLRKQKLVNRHLAISR